MADTSNHPEPLVYSVNDACQISSLGRTRLYELIKEGRIKTNKIGRRTLISASSLKALLVDEA